MSNQYTFKNVNGIDNRGRLRCVAPQELVDKLFPEDDEGVKRLKTADGTQGPLLSEFQTPAGQVYLHVEPSSPAMERAMLDGAWPANISMEIAFRQGIRVDNVVRDKVTQGVYKTISAVATKLISQEQADALADGFVVVTREREAQPKGANLTVAGAEAATGAPTGMTQAIAAMASRTRR